MIVNAFITTFFHLHTKLTLKCAIFTNFVKTNTQHWWRIIQLFVVQRNL